MAVRVELARIIRSDLTDAQVIYLKEVNGTRVLPIVIGTFEAQAINFRVMRRPAARPLTHDLVLNVIRALGAEPHDVIITELREQTYYARLRLRRDGQLIEVDSRPSDAIAIAVTCDPHLPIYVNEDLLEEVAK